MTKNANIHKLDFDKSNALTEIQSLSHDGRGIAAINNKKTFIAGALPQETVQFTILQKRSNYNTAEVSEVISASPHRVAPPCRHFGICGGCSLQHMDVAMQLQLKQTTLLDQLKHFGQVTPEMILPPLNAANTGYRRKARLGVKFVFKKEKVLVGFREKSSNYLAEIESCAVLYPAVGERLQELSGLIASLELVKHIPQIEVGVGDKDIALVFRHLEPISENDKLKLQEFGKNHQFHIYLQPNPPAKLHKIWPEDLNERLTYTLPDYGLEFLFHPLDFTQINLDINRLMVKQALTLLELKPNETVLDLYCGIGNFSLPIAQQVSQVTGIEGSAEMVTRASDNAKHNQITNAEFYAENLDKPSPNSPWIKKRYDKILLDPPRVGAKEILSFIPLFGAKRIVYVSCNPATLARDAGELVHQYGYQLKNVGIMNMFPHTSHIEAMAVFEKLAGE